MLKSNRQFQNRPPKRGATNKMTIKIPREILATFEEIWSKMSEKQKKINLEYWHSIYSKEKLIESVKTDETELKIANKESDYWKKRFEDLQKKLEDPLSEVMSGIKLIGVEDE